MDRGIWATWYDLPADGRDDYLSWLHEEHLPAMLKRHGYLWATHIQNDVSPEREVAINRRLTHTSDPSVPAGYGYLLMFGAENPHTFADPSPAELVTSLDSRSQAMLSRQQGARSNIFIDVERVEGPDAHARPSDGTPGPIVQFGSFNPNLPENDTEISTWYARSRLPLVKPLPGTVGTRKLVSVSGWAKHAILYEFTSLEAAVSNLVDTSDWSRRVVDTLVHAPHSPTLGTRIWPE